MESVARTVVMAALFHDIGKFMHRAKIPPDSRYDRYDQQEIGWNGAHAKGSADFIARYLKDPVIEDLVLYHHNPTKSSYPDLASVVQEADHLSSAMDRKDRQDTGNVLEEPLQSVFPKLFSQKKNPPENRYYPLTSLGIKKEAFPVKKQDLGRWNLVDDYKMVWKQLVAGMESIPSPPPVQTLLTLLQIYTTAIPSAVYINEPDIPLYDHAKTTAVIAHCLLEGEKDEPFLLVQGDLSGIQNFIFATVIPEQARKGTAKRLRGRSFWLTLFMDAVAEEILAECGLFEPSVLWNTGGKFLILAPNTEKNREKIAYISRKVNELLLRKFGGLINLALVVHPVGKDGIRSFSKSLDELAAISAERKKQKFLDCGLHFGVEDEERPLSEFCNVCGVHHTLDTCPVCAVYTEIGTKIARAKWMLKGEGMSISFSEYGLRTGYDLVADLPSETKAQVITLNSTHPGDLRFKNRSGCGVLFLGNTVPIDRNDILSFNEIAQLSTGVPRLGYIKADIDNLGRLIARGLPDESRTISRIHTISTQLQFFFAGYLNQICSEFVVFPHLCSQCLDKIKEGKGREIRLQTQVGDTDQWSESTWYSVDKPCDACKKGAVSSCYITYSGGDDLLIICPWDSAIRLADRIYEEFRRFTCENAQITLSAGIAIVSHRLPVFRAVSIAEGLLEEAKGYQAGVVSKNHVAVFDECLPWREGTGDRSLSSLIETADQMIDAVGSRKISSGMVYSLLTLWNQTYVDIMEMNHETRTKTRINRKKYLPHLKYLMKRNIDDRNRQGIEELITPVFPWIKLPVYWTSLALRTNDKKKPGQFRG
ncbi:type III-A CRISPR-associated protein Cas10/Csm1 [Methanospirillum sp.]|uniref:type III-A CRISPR-associated protein Cas10/Csm1 n=1 Tax=Methanospirillum sp. TaxID=45200 RepID=UPI00359F9C0C